MKTYLLAWNPKRWAWKNLPEMAQQVKDGKMILDRWGTGSSQKLKRGDRFFLIRLGENPKGIFASGEVMTDSFQDLHWDEQKALLGETANYVQIKYDILLDPDHGPILPRELLVMPPLSGMHWEIRMSGIEIPAHIARELERLWAEFTEQL